MYVQVAPMVSKRAGHACEVVNDQMYVMGGCTGPSGYAPRFLSTTEVYDPVANAWRAGPDMGIPRSAGYSGVLDDSIVIVCGRNMVCIPCPGHICCCCCCFLV
jgi:hypothetical protein